MFPGKRIFSRKSTIVLGLLALTLLTPVGPRAVHASPSTNIIVNPSFEQGYSNGVPVGWSNETCEGVPHATVTLDSSRWTDGNQSAKLFVGALENTYCFVNNAPRTVGFFQFRQFPPNGLHFSNLTDSPSGFSFWFYLEPYGNGTIGGFEVRLFGTESTDELDYVFDPNPYVQYPNYTDPTTHEGLRALLFYNYQPGQWYHFSRNLHADWDTLGLNLTSSFLLVQFEGIAIRNNNLLDSETIWLDDVRLYTGTSPPPPETHMTVFNFTDSKSHIVDNLVKWNLVNATNQQVPYTLGQMTLLPGPYYLQAYYRSNQPQYSILNQQIHLDTRFNVSLPMFTNPSIPGGHVVLNNTVGSTAVTQPDTKTLQISIRATAGTAYSTLIDVPSKPRVLQGNGVVLQEGSDWTYDSALSIVRVRFTTPAAGEEDLTVLFAPLIVTTVKDSTGMPVTTAVVTGTTVHVTSILKGASASAGGSLAYNVYNNNGCSGSATTSDNVTVSSGAVPDSNSVTLTTGAYGFQAVYSGDSGNLGSTGACDAVNVTPGGLSLSSSVTETPVTSGTDSVSASNLATLSGGNGPTGAITFSAFTDSTCSGPPIFTMASAVSGNGDYPSPFFIPPTAGTYYWLDSYSGDANNSPVTTPCGASFTVFATPTISFSDQTGASVNTSVSLRIVDSQGNTVPYATGRLLPERSFYLEAYYLSYRIFRAPLSTSTSTQSVTLEMLPTTYGYLALNSTASSVSIGSVSSANIAFTISGGGPYLIVLNVPGRPLYVNANGARTAAWTYNATAQTVSLETTAPGSFQLVFQEASSFSGWILALGIAGVIVATVAGAFVWRRSNPQMSADRARLTRQTYE